MKQIDECLDRFFNNNKQKKTKWQIYQLETNKYIALFNYDHLSLLINPDTLDIIGQWPEECITVKRGIIAALKYLEKNKTSILEKTRNIKYNNTLILTQNDIIENNIKIH